MTARYEQIDNILQISPQRAHRCETAGSDVLALRVRIALSSPEKFLPVLSTDLSTVGPPVAAARQSPFGACSDIRKYKVTNIRITTMHPDHNLHFFNLFMSILTREVAI